MTNKPLEQLHAVVTGRVQGVNFRHYTIEKARDLGVNGWVANKPDGTVEVIAVGPRQKLEALLAFLHTGSPQARVTRVNADWQEASEQPEGFSVRYMR